MGRPTAHARDATHSNGRAVVEENLELIPEGQRVPTVSIGTLTDSRFCELKALRLKHGYPPSSRTIVFVGRHIYKSRIAKDGYTVEDVVDQVASAIGPDSEIRDAPGLTFMQSRTDRVDRYGNTNIRDLAVLEYSGTSPLDSEVQTRHN